MRGGHLRGKPPRTRTARQVDVLAAFVAAGGSVQRRPWTEWGHALRPNPCGKCVLRCRVRPKGTVAAARTVSGREELVRDGTRPALPSVDAPGQDCVEAFRTVVARPALGAHSL